MLRVFQALRIVVVLAIVGVAAIPLLVTIDLVGGGSGWGLCAKRLGNCRTSYFDGPELAGLLTLALFVLVAAQRVLTHVVRRLQRRRDRIAALPVRRPTSPTAGSLSR